LKTSNMKSEKKAPYLSLDEGQLLIRLARLAVTAHLENKTLNLPNATQRLKEKCGAFVTLNKAHTRELRGCIGFPYPDLPLRDATIRAAISAATEDPRFEPVSIDEFHQNIVLEVTVLTPPEILRFDDRKKIPALISIGRHGLIVEGYGTSGLLLPQVAVEWNWDSTDFLSNCCIKAGLPPDYWLLDGTTIKTFEGEIFEEIAPGGKTRRKLSGE